MDNYLRRWYGYLNQQIDEYSQRREYEARQRQYLAGLIEHVVDSIDPRLRSLGGHRKQLSPAVKRVMDYAQEACSLLPGPFEFCKERCMDHATVRALFANPQHMKEIFSYNHEIQAFFKRHPSADAAYMVLGMHMKQVKVLGVDMHGEILRRDIPQTNVSFDDYRISHPSTDETMLRYNLRERALNECVALALSKLMAMQDDAHNLKEKQLKLRMRLAMLDNQEHGLSSWFQGENQIVSRKAEIRKQLDEVEQQYDETGHDVDTLNDVLDKVADLLGNPQELIKISPLSFCVDRLNRLLEDTEATPSNNVDLAQIDFADVDKRVAVLAMFPKREFIEDSKPGLSDVIL